MSSFYGMDISAVRQLATQFDAKAGEIEQISTLLSSTLQGTQWEGPDATRFRDDWQSQHVTALRTVADALREASRAATSNAQQQEQASGI